MKTDADLYFPVLGLLGGVVDKTPKEDVEFLKPEWPRILFKGSWKPDKRTSEPLIWASQPQDKGGLRCDPLQNLCTGIGKRLRGY